MRCPHCKTEISLAAGTMRHHCEGDNCNWKKCAVCKAVIDVMRLPRHSHKLDNALCTGLLSEEK